jgi:hypothetical protein
MGFAARVRQGAFGRLRGEPRGVAREPGVQGVGAQVKCLGNGREREVACLDTIGAEQNLAQERSGARLKRAQERRGLQGVEAFALRIAVRRHGGSKSNHKHGRE